MGAWIGQELERLRERRGLRREDVALQLPSPVSPGTIRNIERVEGYNVSIALLHQIAEVLGARVRLACEPVEEGGAEAGVLDSRCVVDNERFIREVRMRAPDCPLTNSQIGRRMWSFARSRGATLRRGRKLCAPAGGDDRPRGYRSPATTAEYEVWSRDLPALERYADRLSRAYRDDRGRVLVPLA